MRIIILNQFFYPDHSATSQLMTEFSESLVERGVAVTALAGRGRYTGGEKLAPREEHKGVRIERAWATGFGKGTVADMETFENCISGDPASREQSRPRQTRFKDTVL